MLSQKVHYAEECNCLLNNKQLDSKNSILSLITFLDEVGIMRRNGHLLRSPILSYSERHPILLPYHCKFTHLLKHDVHIRSIHGQNQLMLRIIRCDVISRCKRCSLYKSWVCTQIMAALQLTIYLVNIRGPLSKLINIGCVKSLY